MNKQFLWSLVIFVLVWTSFVNYQHFYFTKQSPLAPLESANILKIEVGKIRQSVVGLNKMLDNLSNKTLSIVQSRNW
jgi:hypothetical protein